MLREAESERGKVNRTERDIVGVVDHDALVLRRCFSDARETALEHVVAVEERHLLRWLDPYFVLSKATNQTRQSRQVVVCGLVCVRACVCAARTVAY